MKFFGLLHIERDEKTTVNTYHDNFDLNIKCYVESACKLSKSLKNLNLEFTLLTNDKAYLTSLLSELFIDYELNIETINFTTDVPSGIRFYSAHYKFDVFRYFSTLSDNYVALCDLDILCIQDEIPQNFVNCIENQIPLCFDITDHELPGYGSNRLIKSISSINNKKSQGRWFGGEFIAGSPSFFQKLSKEVDLLFPRYINKLNYIHHIGDEALTSAALENIQSDIHIFDAGKLQVIGRYWSARTGPYVQPPLNSFNKCFLLHFPSDKDFFNSLNFEYNSEIMTVYRKYLFSPKRFLFRFFSWVKRFSKK